MVMAITKNRNICPCGFLVMIASIIIGRSEYKHEIEIWVTLQPVIILFESLLVVEHLHFTSWKVKITKDFHPMSDLIW